MLGVKTKSHLKNADVREAFAASIAEIRFLPGVCPHVCFEYSRS